jgi:RecB family exonuclease
LTLRHHVLRRKSPQRLTFISIDRMVFAGLYRLAPSVLDALKKRRAGDRDPLASRQLPSILGAGNQDRAVAIRITIGTLRTAILDFLKLDLS